MKFQRKFLLPLALVFIICNGFFISAKALLFKWGADNNILIIANSLFLILALITSLIQQRALKNSNPHVFIRSIMAGMMIKMFVCVIAIFIYWFTMRAQFSRITVLIAMLVYFIYLVVEVNLVTKLNRQKNA